jgi:PAS domain S-box-containing protein
LRRNQADLETLQAHYLNLWDRSPVGYCILSAQGRILEANVTAAALLGATPSELIEQPISSFIFKENQNTHTLHLPANGQPQQCELQMIQKDGTPFWARLDAIVAQDEHGTPRIRVALTDITAQKRTGPVSGQSEEWFRLLFQHHALVNLCIDADTGRIIDANAAAVQFYGWSLDELRTMSIEQINTLPPEALQAEMEKAVTAARNRFHFRHRRADGSIREVEVFSNRIEIAGKNFLYSSVHDITERVQAEKALLQRTAELAAAQSKLKQEKGLLAAVMKALPTGVAITDKMGGVLLANVAYERIWSGPRPEIRSVADYTVYKAWWAETGDVVAPEQWASARAVQAGESTLDQILRIERFDGSEAFVINSASPVFDAEGRVVGSAVAIQDITELKRVEHVLFESEQLLRIFIEHAPVALAMFDRDMRYLGVSKRWLSDYGLGDRDLRGLSHYDVFPEMPAHWKEIHRRGLAGEVLREECDRFERLDGSVQWTRWEIRPWHKASGAIGGIVLFTEDVTERKRSEDELRLRNEDLEIFSSAAVGRELRMIELKQEINELCADSGKPPRYLLDFPIENGGSDDQ